MHQNMRKERGILRDCENSSKLQYFKQENLSTAIPEMVSDARFYLWFLNNIINLWLPAAGAELPASAKLPAGANDKFNNITPIIPD